MKYEETNKKHRLWTEKYRPQALNEYIFHDSSHEKAFRTFIENRSIPHLLLTGVQGSGKTTIAQILIKELGIDRTDYLVINASDENSVDVIREKIKDFVSTWAMGEFKVVHLEECDYLSPNAQAVLRRLMEEYSDTARFLMTANYEQKIIPAVKSRTQHFKFKAPDINDITEFTFTILKKESVKFDLETLDSCITVGYPDIRKVINILQQNTHNNKLTLPKNNTQNDDYKFKLLDLLNTDDWENIRKLVCDNVISEEWGDLYRFLYENLHKSTKFSKHPTWEEGIVIIADHLYKDSLVADREINAAAMFIRLSQL